MSRRFGLAAFIVLCLGLLSLSGVAAQDSTPDASTPTTSAEPVSLSAWAVGDPAMPTPEQCTTAPASTDDVAASLLALESRTELPLTSNGVVALAASGPADQTAVDGVVATLTEFWACTNAGNRASLVALMTPNGIADLYDLDLSADETELRAAVAAALTPGDPRAEGGMAGIDGILSVVALEDGRIAALVMNSDPEIVGGDQVTDLFIFIEAEGQYLIDAFASDPFGMVDDYGIE